jgi:hypothetical protein
MGAATGEAGDQYYGLDRFGRVVDQYWRTAFGAQLDHYQYVYDRDSNVSVRWTAHHTTCRSPDGHGQTTRGDVTDARLGKDTRVSAPEFPLAGRPS